MRDSLIDFILELRDGTQPAYKRSTETNYVLDMVLSEIARQELRKSTREAMLDLQKAYLELGRILAKEIRAFYVRVGLLSDNDGGPRDSGAGGS